MAIIVASAVRRIPMNQAHPQLAANIEAWDGSDFGGTKIALVCYGQVVAYLRDDKPDIPFRGLWDMPGGGREGDESPIACGLREVEEEFGLSLDSQRVIALRRFSSGNLNGLDTWFSVATIEPEEIELVRFGSEGQRWLLMTIAEFLEHPRAVPHMKNRLRAAFGGAS